MIEVKWSDDEWFKDDKRSVGWAWEEELIYDNKPYVIHPHYFNRVLKTLLKFKLNYFTVNI